MARPGFSHDAGRRFSAQQRQPGRMVQSDHVDQATHPLDRVAATDRTPHCPGTDAPRGQRPDDVGAR